MYYYVYEHSEMMNQKVKCVTIGQGNPNIAKMHCGVGTPTEMG